MSWWTFLLLAFALAIGAPMLIWAVECAAALLLPVRKCPPATGSRPTVTVLIPAHNEARGIRTTLECLSSQLGAGDAMVVVADNCTDETADIARGCGAIVVERREPDRRGKSYALQFGIDSLKDRSSEVVIVIDADCTAHSGAISLLAWMAFSTGRPVQASYYLEAPDVPGSHRQTTALAFFIRNVVRPGGLARLGLPCFLNGSGMAFPASIVRSINWANGRLAEDNWSTVDLALAGHLPVFCEESRICSPLPLESRALGTQATRWIHGRLECMLLRGPRLVWSALRQRRPALLALALDLLAPPLSFLMVMWLVGITIAVVAALVGGGWLPAAFLMLCGLLIAIVCAAVQRRFGGGGFWNMLAALPRYILSRVRILTAFPLGRQTRWIPTERDARKDSGTAFKSRGVE